MSWEISCVVVVLRVERGRDNAGRRLSGDSIHDIVGEPAHTHTHTHTQYERAPVLPWVPRIERSVCAKIKIVLGPEHDSPTPHRQFLLCHLLKKFS